MHFSNFKNMNKKLFLVMFVTGFNWRFNLGQRVCPRGSDWQPNCDRSCDNRDICKASQNQECFCKENIFRNRKTGQCMEKSKCPIRTCSPELTCERTCGGNKCENVTRNCYCTKSFYRQPLSMKCVKKASCTNTNTTESEEDSTILESSIETEIETSETEVGVTEAETRVTEVHTINVSIQKPEPEVRTITVTVQVTLPTVQKTNVGAQMTEQKVQMTQTEAQITKANTQQRETEKRETKPVETTPVPEPTLTIIGVPWTEENEEGEVYPENSYDMLDYDGL